MLVREVMSSPAVTVRPSTTLKAAAQLLDRHAVTALPVLDGHGALVGVLSEADVIQDAVLPDPRAHELPVHLPDGLRQARVVDVMSHHALTVPADADVTEAADLMISTVVKSLPVTDHGQIVGVISRRDIIRVLARRDELIEAELDELIRVSGEDWVVEIQDGVVTVEGPKSEQEQELAQVLARTVPGVVGIQFKAGNVG
jgi:CBS domain-containing protein